MAQPRIPEVAYPPVTFHAKKNYIVAVFHLGNSTVGVRFQSPEQLLTFTVELMEKAKLTWPNHPLIKEYMLDD